MAVDSRLMICQSARAWPTGSTALWMRMQRRSVLVKVPSFSGRGGRQDHIGHLGGFGKKQLLNHQKIEFLQGMAAGGSSPDRSVWDFPR
jgi:hypothetical protein